MLALCLLLAAPGAPAEPAALGTTWAHDSGWVGVAWEAASAGPGVGMGDLADSPFAIALSVRNVADGPFWYGAGLEQRLRLSRNDEGRVVVDLLSLQARVAGVTVHPALGDLLDLSVLGSRWDQNVYALARPWTQLQLFLPLRLVALGFSDTDADDDARLRYYAAAAGGFGADWLLRIAGPFALRLRAEGAAETMHRVRREEPDQVRHTLRARGEADLLFVGDLGLSVGVWGERHTAWEPKDDPDGVDRQILAGGIRFGVRLLRRTSPVEAPPGASTRVPGHRKNNTTNDRLREKADHPQADPTAPPPPPTPEEHEAANDANDEAIEALRGEDPE